MAATDLADLHNFEQHFEDAAETFLASATGISCVGTCSEDNLTTPRIEVMLTIDEATTPPILHGGGAASTTADYSAYEATFMARIVTDNAVGQTAQHGAYRSKTRAALMQSASNWDSTTLPYYDIKWLQPQGTVYLTDDDFNVTELNWLVRFEIRRDAWPT